jgi:hypothetical protein
MASRCCLKIIPEIDLLKFESTFSVKSNDFKKKKGPHEPEEFCIYFEMTIFISLYQNISAVLIKQTI